MFAQQALLTRIHVFSLLSKLNDIFLLNDYDDIDEDVWMLRDMNKDMVANLYLKHVVVMILLISSTIELSLIQQMPCYTRSVLHFV